MVAYSFKKRFEEPIRAGLEFIPLSPTAKRHTIRADRRRHVRPGEAVQLYCGLRTRHCRLIGVGVCTWVAPIYMMLAPAGQGGKVTIMRAEADYIGRTQDELDRFAKGDGFTDWPDLLAFWAKEHPGASEFAGVIINWEPTAEQRTPEQVRG